MPDALPAARSPEGAPFAGMPATASTHFRLQLHAAVYRLLHYLRHLDRGEADPLKPVFDQYPFLSEYFTGMLAFTPPELSWREGLSWWGRSIARWEAPAAVPLPLREMAALPGMTAGSVAAFMLAGVVEEDSRFGTFFMDLQAPLSSRRASLELLGRVGGVDRSEADPWAVCRPLLELGLAEALHPESPRADWCLRVPGPLWSLVRGDAPPAAPGCRWHASAGFPALSELGAPAGLQEQIARAPDLLRSGQAHAVIVRGAPGSDRLAVAGAVARSLGLDLLAVEPGAPPPPCLGPLCALAGALPVLVYEPGPGETAELPALSGYSGPVAVVLGTEGGVRGRAAERAVTLTLPLPGPAERLGLWKRALPECPEEELRTISARFRLPGGYIRQAAAAAAIRAGLDGRSAVTVRDVQAAQRTLNRQQLDTLADYLEASGSWSRLVIRPGGREKLEELERRCRQREALPERLAPAFGATSRGVRALFTGPSGTGKTMAARILAAELGMELYRIDLAAVFDKYVGETEKNLHRVLAVAEALDVVLLLDEGDVLLGRRVSDPKSANDRYVNLETNYLLQRLEHYDGIVVVTTNLGENIDRAFQRRMDVVVDFLPPQAAERLEIWRLHLPERHAVPDVLLERLAVRCALSGGQIRNAALLATLLAMESASGLVQRGHLEEAVRSEYRKAGAPCPLSAADAPRPRPLDAFIETLKRG